MKNYTSSVDSYRTINKIELILARSGAQNINKTYEAGLLKAIHFTVPINGSVVAILLPAKTEAVFKVLSSKIKRPHHGTMARIKEQANRTAWKLMQDWLEIQLSMIEMEQIELLQAFMGYIYNGQATLYEIMRDNGFKMLAERN